MSASLSLIFYCFYTLSCSPCRNWFSKYRQLKGQTSIFCANGQGFQGFPTGDFNFNIKKHPFELADTLPPLQHRPNYWQHTIRWYFLFCRVFRMNQKLKSPPTQSLWMGVERCYECLSPYSSIPEQSEIAQGKAESQSNRSKSNYTTHDSSLKKRCSKNHVRGLCVGGDMFILFFSDPAVFATTQLLLFRWPLQKCRPLCVQLRMPSSTFTTWALFTVT